MWKGYIFPPLRNISLLVIIIIGCVVTDECDGLSANNNYSARPDGVEITHRASAIFALTESMKKKNAIAIRILEQDPAYLNLDRRDRAFARLLLSTAERRSGQIETVIQSFERKEKKKKNSKVCTEVQNNVVSCRFMPPSISYIFESLSSFMNKFQKRQ